VTVKLLDAEGSVNRPCLHSYFGIGMVTDNSTGVVEQVALGLPAWKAGLRTGDIVTSDVGSMCGGRCSPGMRAKVDWMRGRESFSAEMEVQKICKE
jgi:C-terminal processing protease CtpA/Prc